MRMRMFPAVWIFGLAVCWTNLVFAREAGDAASYQFEFDCHLSGRVAADPHPDYRGTNISNEPWHLVTRDEVDLRAMKYCDPVTCARLGPSQIASLSARRINFYDRPHIKLWVGRRDGQYYERLVNGERVEVTKGKCRKAKFRGLYWHFENGYPVPGHASSGPK